MRTSTALGSAAALGLAAHALPAASSMRWLRVRALPRLSGIGRDGHVALTFDDGPDPASTPQFLQALDDLGWKATFFMLGSMAEQAPGLAAEVAAAGHEIALHGQLHRNLLRVGPRAAVDDLARGFDRVAEAAGVVPTWFRPPYGVLSGAAAAKATSLGLPIVLWTAWGRDWRAEATPDTVLHDVQRHLGTGDTVLLHDSDCTSAPGAWRSALGALPLLAEELARREVSVGTLASHGVRTRTAA